MSNFKVGEVLVGHSFIFDTRYNGVECVVLQPAERVQSKHYTSGIMSSDAKHLVKWADGQVNYVRPRNLRRKQPPAGEQFILDMFKLLQPKRIGEPA